MTEIRVFQVDSFTQRPLTGNPAGVVLGGEALTPAQMQAIARELNNSETAFILPPDGSDHDLRIRFFTPTLEVPSCGHATLAAHYVRAYLGHAACGYVRHKIGAGLLGARIERRNGDFFITVGQRQPVFSTPYNGEMRRAVLEALRLRKGDVADGLPIQRVDTGHPKVLVPVRSRDVLDRIAPDMAALVAFHQSAANAGYFVFTLDAPDEGITAHARMFAPNIGVNEDPVTGNGNGPLGAYLVANGRAGVQDGEYLLAARQGEAIGRPGEVEIRIGVEDGTPRTVSVGGYGVIVFETRMIL